MSMVETPVTLARWAAALGGEARLRAIRSVHLRGVVSTGGLTGRYEEWREGGKLRVELELGDMFRVETGFDGRVAWMRDRTGSVRELSGAERQRLVTAAYLGAWSPLVAPPASGEVVAIEVDGEGRSSLTLVPPGGCAVTVRLDADGLPLGEDMPEADRTRRSTLGDWRDVAGVRLPFSVREGHGEERFDSVVTLSEVEIDAAIGQGWFSRPAEVARDTGLRGGAGAWVPIELNRSHAFVDVVVNGADPIPFLLDTGAGATVIDLATATRLGLPLRGGVEARGAGESSVEASLLPNARVGVAGATLEDIGLVAMPLSDLAPKLGRPLHGVLGYDVLCRLVFEIDYAGSRLRVHDPTTFAYSGAGCSIPIVIEGNHPHVEATITLGERVLRDRFLLDTGADLALALTSPFVRRHGLLDAIKDRLGRYGGGVGGEVENDLGRLDRIVFADFAFRRPLALLARSEKGALASPDVAGIVGGQLLRRFSVVIDYPRLRLVLEPNGDYALPFEHDMAGLDLVTDEGGFVVERVVAGSPAELAGLAAGDRIVAVSGVLAKGLRLAAVRDAWEREGEIVSLTVERGAGERVEISLTTRRLV